MGQTQIFMPNQSLKQPVGKSFFEDMFTLPKIDLSQSWFSKLSAVAHIEGTEKETGCPIANFFKHIFADSTPSEAAVVHDSPFYPEDLELPVGNGVPTAVFHGMGDACIYGGMRQIDAMIQKGTGAYVKCIEVGLPTVGELFGNFETIAESSCAQVAADENFAGEFNVMGLSQGGLLARYMAEECDMPGRVRNIITLGGPHMGVDGIPNCTSGVICDIANFMAKQVVYMNVVQNWFAPAGYFRNVD